jgi:hypothetical protein
MQACRLNEKELLRIDQREDQLFHALPRPGVFAHPVALEAKPPRFVVETLALRLLALLAIGRGFLRGEDASELACRSS